jgi:hypothetical protein
LDGESRTKLPPPFFCEDASMAHVRAAAVNSTSAKGHAKIERLAIASDVLDAQRIILVGAFFGSSIPSEQVDPSCTDASMDGCVFVHEYRAWRALWE